MTLSLGKPQGQRVPRGPFDGWPLQLQGTGFGLLIPGACDGPVPSGPGVVRGRVDWSGHSQWRLRCAWLHLAGPGQSASLVPCLPFWADIGPFPLLSQEGEGGGCGLCHSAHLEARDSKGQKAGCVFLPALRRQDRGKKRGRPVPAASFMLAAWHYLRCQTSPLRFRGKCHLVEEGPRGFSHNASDPNYTPSPHRLRKQPSRGFCPCIIHEAGAGNCKHGFSFPGRIFVSSHGCFRWQRRVCGMGRL